MIKLGRIEFKLLETRDNEFVKSIIEETEYVNCLNILNFLYFLHYRHITSQSRRIKTKKHVEFA